MPQTSLTAMQQQQHVAYAQTQFQHHQAIQQQPSLSSQTQQLQAQQYAAPSAKQHKPIEEQLSQGNQETQQLRKDESQRINASAGGPSAIAAKPQGYAAAAASTNGTASHAKQAQQNEIHQDTMATIDDWNAEDASQPNPNSSETRTDKGNGFRNSGGRGYRGRGGDWGRNQNGDRGGYKGSNSGFRGSERGGGRGRYGPKRGESIRGGGSGEKLGRVPERRAGRADRFGKDVRGSDKGSSARGRGEGGRGKFDSNPAQSMTNGFAEQKVY